MSSRNPFDQAPSIYDLYRQTRPAFDVARSTIGGAENLKRQMDQLDGSLKTFRELQGDPYRNSVDTMLKRIRDKDGWRSTARAIEDAARQRELTLQAAIGFSALQEQRRLAATTFDSGILRTAELLGRNRDIIASAITAARAQDEIAGLASSIIKRMEALRLADLALNAFPKSAVDVFVQEYARAQRAASEFEEVETEEERAAVLATLLMALVNALRVLLKNTRKDILGLSALVLLGAVADVHSLLPNDPPPGMTAEQAQKLEETHRGVEQIQRESMLLRESNHGLDEAYVSTLPRAELKRSATVRAEPRREGKALSRSDEGTLLAVVREEAKWKLVAFRDPLTERLAQGWVYSSNVRMLD